jgi:hypothetical protein
MSQPNEETSISENGLMTFENEKEVLTYYKKDPENN